MTDQYPLLTVVVPVHTEEKYIARTIQLLLDQDYPHDKLEILVGVADSADRTAEVVKEIESREPRVKYFHNPYGFSSGARTLGSQMAKGEIILFVDGHTWIDNNQVFKNTFRLMEEKGVAILSRPQFLDTPENDFFQRAVSLARKSAIGHGLDSTIYTTEEKYVDPTSSGAAYTREVFTQVGYFDTAFDACEDVEFNYRCARAGFRSFTSMKVAVYYYPRSSPRTLFRQMTRYGRGRFRLASKHPRTLSISTLIPALFTGGMPLLGILSLFRQSAWSLFLACIFAYSLAVLGTTSAIALRHGWNYFPALPGIYLTIHTGLGWGFLCELWASVFRPAATQKQQNPGSTP
jgi:succinoglycan biosynthesis protein ExoA